MKAKYRFLTYALQEAKEGAIDTTKYCLEKANEESIASSGIPLADSVRRKILGIAEDTGTFRSLYRGIIFGIENKPKNMKYWLDYAVKLSIGKPYGKYVEPIVEIFKQKYGSN